MQSSFFESETSSKNVFEFSEINTSFPNLCNPEILLTELQKPDFEILRLLQQKLGAEIHLEGGTVRDSLLGIKSNDFDFVVSFPQADPSKSNEELIEDFENFFGQKMHTNDSDNGWIIKGEYGTLKLTGENFGVYQFRPKGSNIDIDISFPRVEHAGREGLGGAKHMQAQSNLRMGFEQEVKRRDFTCNGIGIKLDFTQESQVHAQIVDYVGGLDDLNNRVLRAIGNPYERFGESLDRLVRGIRFAITKGLTIEENTYIAMREIINGEFDPTLAPPFIRKYPDGKDVMGRPNLGINLVKPLYQKPVETITMLDDLGGLNYLLGPLKKPHKLQSVPREINRELKESLEAWQPNDLDNLLRNRFFDLSLHNIKEYQQKYQNIGMDEIMFLLSLDLGKCSVTLKEEKEGRFLFNPDYVYLSKTYMNQMMRTSGLDTIPQNSIYKTDAAKVGRWIELWPKVLSILSNPELLEHRGDLLKQAAELFPDLSQDEFWKLAKCYLANSPDTRAVKGNLEYFEKILKEMEAASENRPFSEKEMLGGSDLIQIFHMAPSPDLGRVLKKAYSKYWLQVYRAEKPITVEEAKLGIFMEISRTDEMISHWNEKISPNDIKFLATGDNYEYVRRALHRSIEQRVFEKYLGAPMEHFLDDANFAKYYEERYSVPDGHGNEVIRYDTLTLLSHRLAEDPIKTMQWLEECFADKKSIMNHLFPELKAMIGCDQPQKYHQEGDVWTHTKLLFKKAEDLNIPMTPRLALAILFHDIGKPPTQEKTVDDNTEEEKITFFGHAQEGVRITEQYISLFADTTDVSDYWEILSAINNHMNLYLLNKPLSALKIKEMFPFGDDSIAYNLAICDDAASIGSQKEDFEQNVIVSVNRWSDKIKLERELDVDYFDEVILQNEHILKILSSGVKPDQFYEAYLENISGSKLPTEEEVINTYCKQSLENCFTYIKLVKWPASRISGELGGLSGIEIKQYQQAEAQKLFDALSSEV